MMTISTEQLLPCPFCGESLVQTRGGTILVHPKVGSNAERCIMSLCSMHASDTPRIAAWNRRSGVEGREAAAYDRGRRDMLNALLALNPRAANALHIGSGGTEETFTNQEGKLPFDVVFWVTTVADQLGIEPKDNTHEA